MIPKRKFPFLVCFVLLVAQSVGVFIPNNLQRWKSNPLLRDLDLKEFKRLIETRAKIESDGCDVNVCFIIDGSWFIKPSDFTIEKHFVNLIANIISTDKRISFCGVQYSTITTPISPLTNSIFDFLNALKNAKRAGGGTNLTAALGYAISQMLHQVGKSNHIIVLGEFNVNYFAPPIFERIVAPFKALGGSVSIVPVGPVYGFDPVKVAGSADKVFPITKYSEVINVANKLIQQVCIVNSNFNDFKLNS